MTDGVLRSSAWPRWRRTAGEAAACLLAVALLAFAVSADRAWVDRHFMPEFRISRGQLMAEITAIRLIAASLGLALALVIRPRIGRRIEREGFGRLARDTAPILLAVALAFVATELTLRLAAEGSAARKAIYKEPLRVPDRELGFVPRPGRVGWDEVGGRRIAYAFDAHGARVAAPDRPVDPARPTVLFVGESAMMGHGLDWSESIPGQVQAITGVQTADLAFSGYSLDQAYMRLRRELPRFRRPVGVVTLFLPSVAYRLLDPDRPHLDQSLRWRPRPEEPRLLHILRRLLPYRSESDVDEAVRTAQALLRATIAAAHARGATALVLVPVLEPETPQEAVLRRRVLDDGNIPYLLVRIRPEWRIRGDGHPDPRGARAVAEAVAARLAGGAI